MGAHLGESGRCPSKVGLPYCQSFRLHKSQFSNQSMFFPVLDLLREPLSAAAHTAGEHVRKLGSSGAFSCSYVEPAYVKKILRRRPTLVKAIPRLQMCGNCLVRTSRTTGRTKYETGRLNGPIHPARIPPIPSSSLPVGSVCHLGSSCLRVRDRTTAETDCCIAQMTSKDILDRNARFLREVETSWCGALCPLLHNVMMGPLQKSKIFES